MINLTLKRAVAIAMLAGASVAANAAEQNVGTVKFDVPTSFNGSVLKSAGDATASLNDIIRFTPEGPAASAGFSVINFPLTLPSGDLGLSLATVSLNSAGADGIIGDKDDVMLKASVFSDLGNTNGHISFSYDKPLAASEYFLTSPGLRAVPWEAHIRGSISISPVPEPETYAMLLAGLGLMGAVVRRRSMRKNS